MPAPQVTVLMPVHNSERWLDEAVQSLFLQTFRDFELLVVDDGSTDGSSAMIDRYAACDPRVRVLRRARTGIVGALNDGLHAARGELVARLDAEDVALPERLARQVAWLDRHPECVALGSAIEVIDPYGSPTKRPRQPLVHDEIDASLLSGYGWALVHPAVMMRRQIVLDVGGYRSELEKTEDLDLFLRLAERGRLANLPEILVRYRQHLGSISRESGELQSRLKIEVVRQAYARRGVPPPDGFERTIRPERPLAPAAQHLYWGAHALRHGRATVAARHARAALAAAPRTPAGLWATVRSVFDAARMWRP